MNIFVTDPDPKKSAQNLDDKRVIKMILESAQLMSTAINLMGGFGPYKSTHINHPCSIWVRTSAANYYWLLDHFVALCDEYNLRYGKIHKCKSFFPVLSSGVKLMPQVDSTPWCNCTPHKDMEVIAAYQLTMTEKWANDKRPPTWKNNLRPTF